MVNQQEQYDDDGDQYSTIKRSPYTKTNSNNSQVTTPVDPEPPQQLNYQSNNNAVIQNGRFSFKKIVFKFIQ